MKRMFMLNVMVALMAVCLLVSTMSAAAEGAGKDKQTDKAQAGAGQKSKPADSGKKGQASGGNKVVLKEIQIEGKIHKPQAYYLLQRSNLNLESLELNDSFVPNIVKSVDEEPF